MDDTFLRREGISGTTPAGRLLNLSGLAVGGCEEFPNKMIIIVFHSFANHNSDVLR